MYPDQMTPGCLAGLGLGCLGIILLWLGIMAYDALTHRRPHS